MAIVAAGGRLLTRKTGIEWPAFREAVDVRRGPCNIKSCLTSAVGTRAFSNSFVSMASAMNRYPIFSTFVGIALLLPTSARSQEAKPAASAERNTAKIEPYTGPPIYLPEDIQVEATLVNKRVHTEPYDDGKPKFEREISTFSDERMVNDGFYREYFANGQIFLEGQYERGTPIGQWKYYHDNGQLAKTVNFEDGKPAGEIELRRADGTLDAKRTYNQGKRDGTWTAFDVTGEKPSREEHYVDGKPDGVWKIWFDDGKQSQEIAFRDGKRHGVSTEWDKEGVKRAEVNFGDGEKHGKSTLWTADGKVIEQTFSAGKLVSQPATN